MNKTGKTIRHQFKSRFQKEPFLIQSPGRVNLIGEHTDYNNGFVLPAAIDKVIIVAIAPNGGSDINLVAVDMDETFHHDLALPLAKSAKGWPDYILGVIDQLRKAGHTIEGFDCVFGGNIPIGAGLSSSAALEGGIIYGLSAIFDLDISRHDMALMAQKAENDFVGVQCGIMDQFVSIHGEAGHALKLDCRSLDYELYPLDRDDIHIVLCDTKIRRELATSEYNIRRQQCEQGVKVLKNYDSSVESLRDVEKSLLKLHKEDLDPVIFKRCKYVLEENRRVQEACEDLLNDDLEAFGEKMYASHAGLRDLYEVSCRELDILVEEAQKIDGVVGARMMGGGFGGCTINLVRESCLDTFPATIQQKYHEETGKDIHVYLTQIGAGTQSLSLADQEIKGSEL